VAVDRLGAVDEWAAERIALVEAEADRRRQEPREVAGAVLRALRGRGQAITTIVELAGVPEGAGARLSQAGRTARRVRGWTRVSAAPRPLITAQRSEHQPLLRRFGHRGSPRCAV
jgi:hypothetical protein